MPIRVLIFILILNALACEDTVNDPPSGDVYLTIDLQDDVGNQKDQDSDLNQLVVPPPIDSASSIALVVAHPDDEFYISPILVDICKRKECLLVVLTEGEAGSCELANGCAPSVAEVRKSELKNSAKFLNMKLEHWDLGDGKGATLDAVLRHWAQDDPEQLVEKLATLLNAHGVELVFGFDPRHGTSCHADHRAAGALLVEAAKESGIAESNIFLIENALWGECQDANPLALAFRAAVPDDRSNLEINVSSTWFAISEVLKIHDSQFKDGVPDLIENAPTSRRNMYLQSLELADAEDERYEGICPDLVNICN